MLWLEHNNYPDYKRVFDLYEKWDMAAKSKDFHNAEHFEYMIKKIHDRNGIKES
jgi:hypothetical protein